MGCEMDENYVCSSGGSVPITEETRDEGNDHSHDQGHWDGSGD